MPALSNLLYKYLLQTSQEEARSSQLIGVCRCALKFKKTLNWSALRFLCLVQFIQLLSQTTICHFAWAAYLTVSVSSLFLFLPLPWNPSQGTFKGTLLKGKCSNVHLGTGGIYFATESHCLLLSDSAFCVLMVSKIRGTEIPEGWDVTDLSRLPLFCKYLLALWNFHNDKTEII